MAATGTIVIEPPDGDMTTYLVQLERLAALRPTRFVPAHGEIIEDPVERLQHYIAHRLGREAKVLQALTVEPQELRRVTERSYPELQIVLLPLADRSCLAHLLRLQELGQAQESEGAWSLR